ncbi:MAG: fasciclin domain-containing protein [Anaerolineae bacterium]
MTKSTSKVRISKVLPLLALAILMAATAVPALAAPPGPTIVDVAIAANSDGPYAGAFDTLIAALMAADPAVIRTLDGNGQFTVFAPTDDAFADLGYDASTIGALDQDFLTDVLLYHVAHGRRYAADVLDSSRIRTLQKGFLFQDGGTLTDNLNRDANIIVTDVEAANGIIHAIDAVVLPYAP